MKPFLTFVRHGETDANRAGVLVGHSEYKLTAEGRKASRAVGRELGRGGNQASELFTSPLLRAVDTAVLIGKTIALEPEIDERLVEVNYGEYEGRRPRDVPDSEWSAWRSSLDFRPPGGESFREVSARVVDFCNELLDRRDEGPFVAISHVSPIKCAIAWALQLEADVMWRLHLSLSSVSRIYETDGVPHLVSFNETGHLRR